MNARHGTNHGASDNDAHGHEGDPPTGGRDGLPEDEVRQSLPASRLASAADRLGPRLVLAAQDQGYTAAWNGDHVNTCPWLTATTERDLALRQMWIRGYSAGRTDLRIARERPE
jgi:ribosome modulation factor